MTVFSILRFLVPIPVFHFHALTSASRTDMTRPVALTKRFIESSTYGLRAPDSHYPGSVRRPDRNICSFRHIGLTSRRQVQHGSVAYLYFHSGTTYWFPRIFLFLHSTSLPSFRPVPLLPRPESQECHVGKKCWYLRRLCVHFSASGTGQNGATW